MPKILVKQPITKIVKVGSGGPPGPVGPGFPGGGNVGQIPRKVAGDFNSEWSDTAPDTDAVSGVASATVISRIGAVEVGQGSNVYGYATKALMDADLVPADQAIAYVTNDATPANNGTWRKLGASGSGSWVQSSYDRVAIIEQTAVFPDETGRLLGSYIDGLIINPTDIEMTGDSVYGQMATGTFEEITKATTFNQIEIFIKTTIDDQPGVELQLYECSFNPQTQATPFSLAGATLLETVAVDNPPSTLTKRLFDLPETVTVSAGTWLVVVAVSTISNVVQLGRWTTDPSGTRGGILYNTTSRDATAMSRGGASYSNTSFRLKYKSQIEQDLDSLEATAATIDGSYNIKVARFPYITNAPALGDGEMDGSGNYEVSYVGGFYETVAEDVLFNMLQGRIWCADETADVDWKLWIRDTAGSFDASTVAPDSFGTVLAGSFPTTNQLGTFRFDAPLLALSGQTVFMLFIAQNNAKIAFRTWAYDAGVIPARTGFIFNAGSTGWPTAFTFGNPTLGYGKVSAKLFNESEERREVGGGDALQTEYNPAATRLEATTVQGAIDELAAETLGAPRIIAPDEITAVVGDTLQIFHRGVLESPAVLPNQVRAACDIGGDYPRYFEVTPVLADVGSHNLTLDFRNHDNDVITERAINLEVVNPSGQPSAMKNIICIGDSLTEGGGWPMELYRRLVDAGGYPVGHEYGNINFIGKTFNQSDPNMRWVGYGGWRWLDYLGNARTAYWVSCVHTKTTADQHSRYVDSSGRDWLMETIEATRIKFVPYTHLEAMPAAPGALIWSSGGTDTTAVNYTAIEAEPSTPFWDPDTSAVSFSAFCEEQGETGIDIAYFLLGWNGMSSSNQFLASDHSVQIAEAKELVDFLHADYPLAEVRLLGLQGPSPTGGLAANYNAGTSSHFYEYLRSMHGYNLALQEWANDAAYSGFTRYIGVAAQFDLDNNMPQEDVQVNTRNAATAKRGTNGIHPDTPGYLQIADVAYRDFIRSFCS